MLPSHARAAVFTAPGQDLEIRRFPLRPPETGGMLVKIDCCTICGSDVHSWAGRRPNPTPGILGHEIVGTIAALGSGVTHDCRDRPLRVGDRVTWTLTDVCGRCRFCCLPGLTMKCRHLKKYGHQSCETPPHLNGGFAEYCHLTPGTRVVRIPEGLTDREVAPANCALATVLAGWEALGSRPPDSVLIMGAGALGVYAAAVAAQAGCRRIIVTDVRDHRLAFVRAFGATDTLNVQGLAADRVAAAVRDLTEGIGADGVLEVAGVPALVPLSLKCLRIGGCCVEIGNSFPGADFTCDAGDIVWRRLTLTGIHNYEARHLLQAVELLATARTRVPFDTLVTHSVPLERINEGLRLAASGDAVRVAVCPS